nr:hypothetical protein Iba_chr11bCG8500 [Ipomoea batatas]
MQAGHVGAHPGCLNRWKPGSFRTTRRPRLLSVRRHPPSGPPSLALWFVSYRTPIRPDESIARSTTEIPSQRARMVLEIRSRLCGFDASWRKISASCWERVTDEESLGIVVVEWRGRVFGRECEEEERQLVGGEDRETHMMRCQGREADLLKVVSRANCNLSARLEAIKLF